MARTARSVVADGYYHLINRGNNRTTLFHDRADYIHFTWLLSHAQRRVPLHVLAVCLMPNHVHVVVRPNEDRTLSRWTHWLFTTHARHHHMKYGTTGRVWQGRYKAFIIEDDAYLLTVMRYVERNPVRAGLVSRAEEWEWGSLRWRLAGGSRPVISAPPFALPADWATSVNQPETASVLEAIRTSINRQRPFGSPQWVERTARRLCVEPSLAPVGRPRKRQ
jgi:putative transposase